MKRIPVSLTATLILASIAAAADVKIKVTLAEDKTGGKPVTSFPADAPTLFARFSAEGLNSGDKLRGVWIADDVGDAAPKGTKIEEKTLTAEGSAVDGNFSLSKPTNGWPAGKYKLEIYANDKLVNTTGFSIRDSGKESTTTAAAVPDEKELKTMVTASINAFGDAVKEKDFSGFYLEIASVWQEQTSAEKLEEAFKDFYDKEIDLPGAIKGKEPVFDKKATVDSASGVLVVNGYYPTKPNRIVFQLKYLKEDSDWKLVGINVNLKE